MNKRLAAHALTAALLLPTLLIAGIWLVNAFRTHTSTNTRTLSPITTWTWRWGQDHFTLERIGPDVPFATTLPSLSNMTPGPEPGSFGVQFQGRPPVDPFGWFQSGSGVYMIGHRLRPVDEWSVSMMVPLLATAPPFWLAVRRLSRPSLRALRRQAGLCVACGYDLRATTDRCPECGESIV